MAGNTNLNKAKKAKSDEFYTSILAIEDELKHYAKHFKNQVVYCNCDDPEWSEFFAYFYLNFEKLGLKKLICSFYNPGTGVNLSTEKPYISIVEPDENGKLEYIKINLNGNGDFSSDECKYFLSQSNIVCTNPPFSLFRKYVAQLMKYEKKFIIIGNKNAITYKEFFPLIKNNKVWIGYNAPCEFGTPEGITKKVNGLCRWFTNLDIKKRHENLILWKTYTPEEFPKYDNYDAINVDKVANIPCDYYETMGVPITFMDKFNPDQFEIIGLSEDGGKGLSNGLRNKNSKISHPLIRGSRTYRRLFIRHYINDSSSVKWFPINDKNRDKAMKLIEDYGFLYRNGVMGVPITFLDKFNPKQFEIIGITKTPIGNHLRTKIYPQQTQHNKDGSKQNVMKLNDGAAIKIETGLKDKPYYKVNDALFSAIYPRILIKKNNTLIDNIRKT